MDKQNITLPVIPWQEVRLHDKNLMAVNVPEDLAAMDHRAIAIDLAEKTYKHVDSALEKKSIARRFLQQEPLKTGETNYFSVSDNTCELYTIDKRGQLPAKAVIDQKNGSEVWVATYELACHVTWDWDLPYKDAYKHVPERAVLSLERQETVEFLKCITAASPLENCVVLFGDKFMKSCEIASKNITKDKKELLSIITHPTNYDVIVRDAIHTLGEKGFKQSSAAQMAEQNLFGYVDGKPLYLTTLCPKNTAYVLRSITGIMPKRQGCTALPADRLNLGTLTEVVDAASDEVGCDKPKRGMVVYEEVGFLVAEDAVARITINKKQTNA